MIEPQSLISIKKGTCHFFYAYDIGTALDLPKCLSRMVASGGYRVSERSRRLPKYFSFDNPPLMLIQDAAPIQLGPLATQEAISLTLYDFGAVSIGYRIAFSENLENLCALSIELEKNETILADSLVRIKALMEVIKDAIDHPQLVKPVEDYAIFEIYDFKINGPLAGFIAQAELPLSQILRAEFQDLSKQEIADAMMHSISYGTEDIAIIDWNASLIVSRDADDIREVLEFANVELLEMRVLDVQLDAALDSTYTLTYKVPRLLRFIPGTTARILHRISRMQLESAILLERVSNAPKLLGDQFLARVYRLAAQRFHLSEWNATIQRKLDTIENFYEQVHEGTVGLRMEILEGIIIVLIAAEIIILFIVDL